MITNNDIMKKLRVAHSFRDDDILKVLELVDFKMTKPELNAIFQKEGHQNYKECGDQLLRNFLNGLIIHLRGPMPKKEDKPEQKKSFTKPHPGRK
ncbi:MAG: hypothetical protein ACI8RY_000748 [Urechidicola sp.]|jgi:uncharacterized protein YehS (DUF1456 family)|tara:strand:- start:224 stop:508 length:285 start_codon:yes stop_codon:yes gene_type:complete